MGRSWGEALIAHSLEDTYPLYDLGDHEAERRRMDRFRLRRPHSWALRVEHSSFASDSLLDINSTGMRIVLPSAEGIERGSRIYVELCLADKELVKAEAEIRWIKVDAKNSERSYVGLEFIDPYCKIARAWIDQEIHLHVRRLEHKLSQRGLLERLKALFLKSK